MSYNKKVQHTWDKYPNQESQKPSKESKRLPTNELKELIQNEVYDILSGIKTEIEGKMKEVDTNIVIIRNEIMQLKKAVAMKSSLTVFEPNQVETTLREMFSRVDKIQKQVAVIKNLQNFNDSSSYINAGDVSKSNISTYKLNQSVQKNYSKQKSNSSLFTKNTNQAIDLGTLIFQDDKSHINKTLDYPKQVQGSPVSKSQQKKASIFSNPYQQNLRKPPLPSTDLKPKFSTSNEMATSSSFYDQPLRNQNYEQPRTNQIMPQVNTIQKVQKQLSKNKSVFMRKKKSEEKMDSPPKGPERSFTSHRFENQLQDFSPSNQDESFNIELEYSKDTFLSDL